MKRLNNILHYGVAAIIILGAFSSTFAQKGTDFSLFGTRLAQNERDAKYDLLTPDFTFIASKYLKSDASEYPKPDFSNIEKWYEVVKWQYGDFEGGDNTLSFWIKPKTDTRPTFHAEYYDNDGVLVGNGGWYCACEGNCYANAPIGTVQKYHADAPTERDMKNVKTVKITRKEN